MKFNSPENCRPVDRCGREKATPTKVGQMILRRLRKRNRPGVPNGFDLRVEARQGAPAKSVCEPDKASAGFGLERRKTKK